jgi:hypothetical protein
MYSLQGRTPIEIISSKTPDISEWLEFKFYQPVWYLSPCEFTEQRRSIGRWLRVSHRVVQAMCYWILAESAKPISQSTVQAVTLVELAMAQTDTMHQDFDCHIKAQLSRGNNDLFDADIIPTRNLGEQDVLPGPMETEGTKSEIVEYDEESNDNLLTTQVLLFRCSLDV